jgi:tRNA1Val (adenine37-N6)-methyltransferase
MNSLNSSNNLLIEQPIDGYRYSIEPFLIADFAKLYSEYRLLDIGTGCGIIPLLITTQIELKEIVGIEIQKSLYDFAVNNISNNDLSKKVRLIHGDFIKTTIDDDNQPFDIIVSNPPYRKLNTGRINPKHEKAIARHELSITLETLIKKAGKLLKHQGTFCMAYPPTRLNEVQEKLHSHKLFPSRIRFIHGSSNAEARIFLIEAVKEHQVDCIIEPPLFVYNNDGLYSEKMEKIYASFNYNSWTDYIKEE